VNYSIHYKNARGATARSETLPFASDAEAVIHGRAKSGVNAIIEVWKGDRLVVRLFGLDTSAPTSPLS
jgi:hypothetical protein